MPFSTGVVLSGGGVRGAYEVGVVAGIVEALELSSSDQAPFRIFTGTSVGAINAGYLAANCHAGDLNIEGLADLWRSLQVETYVRLHGLRTFWRRYFGDSRGWSILDAKPLAKLVAGGIDWQQLQRNAESGDLSALIVAALDIASGRTTMFAQTAARASFRPSLDPLRNAVMGPITADHILASAALPFLFPARRVGDTFFCDGGLRYNTPIAPAIRAGSDKLVIIPVLKHERPASRTELRTYPNLTFMSGKLVNALLADPVERDLQMLTRLNRVVEVLEETLDADELARVHEVWEQNRGAHYRKLDTLIIRPTADIGIIAGDRIREGVPGPAGWIFKQVLRRTGAREADWASYVLFDGKFADQLIELGRRDAMRERDKVRAFFDA